MLVLGDPDFSENFTFLLSDWFAHTPQDVDAVNFRKTVGDISVFDVNTFPAAKTISAAFVEVEPGGMR